MIGQLAPDKKTWTVGEPLGYGKTYTWAGTAKGIDGKSAPISGSFTTVTPTRQIDASLNVGDGKTYGVGDADRDHVRPGRDRQGERAEGADGHHVRADRGRVGVARRPHGSLAAQGLLGAGHAP